MAVKVMNSSAKYLSLEMLTHDNFLGTTSPQKVSSFTFYKKSVEKGEMNIIWSVESQDKAGQQLTKLIYGETPVGFKATTPQPLVPGDALYISFYANEQGIPKPLGTVEFTVSR